MDQILKITFTDQGSKRSITWKGEHLKPCMELKTNDIAFIPDEEE